MGKLKEKANEWNEEGEGKHLISFLFQVSEHAPTCCNNFSVYIIVALMSDEFYFTRKFTR